MRFGILICLMVFLPFFNNGIDSKSFLRSWNEKTRFSLLELLDHNINNDYIDNIVRRYDTANLQMGYRLFSVSHIMKLDTVFFEDFENSTYVFLESHDDKDFCRKYSLDVIKCFKSNIGWCSVSLTCDTIIERVRDVDLNYYTNKKDKLDSLTLCDFRDFLDEGTYSVITYIENGNIKTVPIVNTFIDWEEM